MAILGRVGKRFWLETFEISERGSFEVLHTFGKWTPSISHPRKPAYTSADSSKTRRSLRHAVVTSEHYAVPTLLRSPLFTNRSRQ